MSEYISKEDIAAHYVTPGHPTAFSSPGAIYRFYEGNIPIQFIKEALETVHGYASHREYKQPSIYNPFFSYQRRRHFQIDLIDVQALKNANKKFAYLALIIDVFSRKIWVYAMKRKTMIETAQVIKDWLELLAQEEENFVQRKKSLYSDRGSEFVNSKVEQVLADFNMSHATSKRGLQKAAIAERANKTLQTRLYKYLFYTGRKNYIDVLPELVSAYNNANHRTLKNMTPNEADLPENEVIVRELHSNRYFKLWNEVNKARQSQEKSHALGSMVLIKEQGGKKISKFNRAYTRNFKNDYYVIVAVKKRMPVPMYRVRSLKTGQVTPGSFYANELSRVFPRKFKIEKTLKRRGEGDTQQRFVRFVGLHPVFDSWVYVSDIDANHRVPIDKLQEEIDTT